MYASNHKTPVVAPLSGDNYLGSVHPLASLRKYVIFCVPASSPLFTYILCNHVITGSIIHPHSPVVTITAIS